METALPKISAAAIKVLRAQHAMKVCQLLLTSKLDVKLQY